MGDAGGWAEEERSRLHAVVVVVDVVVADVVHVVVVVMGVVM